VCISISVFSLGFDQADQFFFALFKVSIFLKISQTPTFFLAYSKCYNVEFPIKQNILIDNDKKSERVVIEDVSMWDPGGDLERSVGCVKT
jgi:hypothetical protein